MTAQPERRAGDLHVSHHRFFLIDDSTHLSGVTTDLYWQDVAIATTAPGILAVNTKVHTGLINLVVERHIAAPPPGSNAGYWDATEEHRGHFPSGCPRVATLFNQPPPDLHNPISGPPGEYTARVHRRRHDVVDDPAFDPAESYLVQYWFASAEA